MKIYIETKPHPWVTWGHDLWKQNQNTKTAVKIVSVKSQADTIMIEYDENDETFNIGDEKKLIIYVESATIDGTYKLLELLEQKSKDDVLILSDSLPIISELAAHNWTVYKWNKPTRVPEHLLYVDHVETMNKTGGFVITSKGDRTKDNLGEILKTYFAMCLTDDPDNEGQLVCMQDVDIFSAYDLPFETFNNINFHGLQPNPKMFKFIKNAKLFISPYQGDGIPINAVDAVMLGTPVLVRDTETNRSIFNWDERCFFRDDMELAKKIKYFAEIDVNSPEYVDLVRCGYNAIKWSHSASISLIDLDNIIMEKW